MTLVDRRFERPLTKNERRALEAQLVQSPVALERYRRLHLLERVVALGPDRALEEPSPAEIDRIAVDLGLVDEPRTAWSWLGRVLSMRIVGATFVAAAAVAVLLLFVPRSEVVTERGLSVSGVSVAAYVVTADGMFRPLDATPVGAGAFLKVRVTKTPNDRVAAVRVVVLDAAGARRIVPLDAPTFDTNTVAIPGAVAMSGWAKGAAEVFVVLSPEPIDDTDLQTGGATEMRVRLGPAVTVERFVVEIESP